MVCSLKSNSNTAGNVDGMSKHYNYLMRFCSFSIVGSLAKIDQPRSINLEKEMYVIQFNEAFLPPLLNVTNRRRSKDEITRELSPDSTSYQVRHCILPHFTYILWLVLNWKIRTIIFSLFLLDTSLINPHGFFSSFITSCVLVLTITYVHIFLFIYFFTLFDLVLNPEDLRDICLDAAGVWFLDFWNNQNEEVE